MKFDRVEDAIEEIRQGRMVIVADTNAESQSPTESPAATNVETIAETIAE